MPARHMWQKNEFPIMSPAHETGVKKKVISHRLSFDCAKMLLTLKIPVDSWCTFSAQEIRSQ